MWLHCILKSNDVDNLHYNFSEVFLTIILLSYIYGVLLCGCLDECKA